MKILQFIPSLEPETGGPARSVPALCSALAELGVEVVLARFCRRGEREAGGVHASVRCEAFHPFPGTRQLPSWHFVDSFLRLLEGTDVVHLNSIWNPAVGIAAALCRRRGVPYVLSPRGMLQNLSLPNAPRRKPAFLTLSRREAVEMAVDTRRATESSADVLYSTSRTLDRAQRRRHGHIRRRSRESVRNAGKRLYYALWERRTVKGAAHLVYFTAHEAAQSQEFTGALPHFSVIPNGVETPDGEPVEKGRFRRRFLIPGDRPLLLALGRLHPVKRLELQLEALALIVRRKPAVLWCAAGPDAGAGAGLRQRVRALNLDEHVLFPGPLNRQGCREALSDANLFLLTSLHEAHSMAMNEALAAGVPVVATQSVGFPEIDSAGCGRIVEEQPDRLADAVVEMLDDPRRVQEMGASARQFARDRLGWREIAVRTQSIYEDVRNRRNHR